MTRQESFKRRIRERMAKTGERYGAARRVLIERSDDAARDDPGRGDRAARRWAADPEIGDDAILEATGRRWNDWCDLIDGWPGKDDGHAAIATHLQEEHGIGGWWAQSVTVGYERITGRRLPHQRADGTFSAGRSRTVTVDAAVLREMLLDDADRSALFPGLDIELRSRPTSKNVRLAMGEGTAEIDLTPRDGGRVKVTIAHERLPEYEAVERWKSFWGGWLDALDEA